MEQHNGSWLREKDKKRIHTAVQSVMRTADLAKVTMIISLMYFSRGKTWLDEKNTALTINKFIFLNYKTPNAAIWLRSPEVLNTPNISGLIMVKK